MVARTSPLVHATGKVVLIYTYKKNTSVELYVIVCQYMSILSIFVK